MDQVAAIRHAAIVLGRSRRWAARTFIFDRATVDRYVDGDVAAGKRKPTARHSPRRQAALAELPKLIAKTAVAKKQQLTAQRAHELLKERGVDVGYTLVKELMAERRRASAEVFILLQYPAGDLGEVDFFEVELDVDGVRTTAFLFLMRLMASPSVRVVVASPAPCSKLRRCAPSFSRSSRTPSSPAVLTCGSTFFIACTRPTTRRRTSIPCCGSSSRVLSLEAHS